jgi:hypothetical protein
MLQRIGEMAVDHSKVSSVSIDRAGVNPLKKTHNQSEEYGVRFPKGIENARV